MAQKTAGRGRDAPRSPAKTPSPKPDALEILIMEHRRFDALLAQGERTRKGRRELLESLIAELAAHERMEEQVLYPALLSYSHTRETLTEGLHEHDSAEALENALRGIPTDGEEWDVRFKALKENLQHHMEHEERHLFPVARGLFSREQLQELAGQMRAVSPARRPPARRRRQG